MARRIKQNTTSIVDLVSLPCLASYLARYPARSTCSRGQPSRPSDHKLTDPSPSVRHLCPSQTQDDVEVFEIPPSPDATGATPLSSRRKASSPQAGPGPSSSATQRRGQQKNSEGKAKHVEFEPIELSDSDEDVPVRARMGQVVVNAGCVSPSLSGWECAARAIRPSRRHES